MASEPTTPVPSGGYKQPTKPPTTTKGARIDFSSTPWGRLKHGPLATPRGNGPRPSRKAP